MARVSDVFIEDAQKWPQWKPRPLEQEEDSSNKANGVSALQGHEEMGSEKNLDRASDLHMEVV